MNGVIYARYSTDSQREESIEGQLRECMEFAERQGITVVGQYIDRALSAKTDDRPDFQRMIKDSAKRLFDVVIVWKLDRFSRNRYDSARYKSVLKKNGIRVISAKENISDRPEGILLEAMLEGYAEYFSADLSEKVLRGMTENALKCKSNGSRMPFGYKTDNQQNYLLNEDTAPIVKEVFIRYADGETITSIINDLNERGLRTTSGTPFNRNSFSTLLHNRKYIGEYKFNDVVIPNGVPSIISEELFTRVQQRLASNKKMPARSKAKVEYLLTTKLYCGECGGFMVGESGTNRHGNTYYYYKCANSKHKKGCNKKPVKKAWIEQLVVDYTMKYALTDTAIEHIAEAIIELQQEEDAGLPMLRSRLLDVTKAIDNMLNAIQMGVITPSTKERLEKLEADKVELEINIARESMQRPILTKEQIVFWISRFRNGDIHDPKFCRRLIDGFVNAVYLYDDRIVLTYNYKDGAQTISVAEIESALAGGDDGSDLTYQGVPNDSDIVRYFRFMRCSRKRR